MNSEIRAKDTPQRKIWEKYGKDFFDTVDPHIKTNQY